MTAFAFFANLFAVKPALSDKQRRKLDRQIQSNDDDWFYKYECAFGRFLYVKIKLSYNSSADSLKHELCLIQLCTVPVCVILTGNIL